MERSLAKGIGAAAVAAALIMGVALVGDATAGGGGITEPQVIELVTTGCSTNDDDPMTDCHTYLLEDTQGKRTGDLFLFKVPIWDVDGNRVGKGVLQCTSGKATGQICTVALALKASSSTEAGTIVATGHQAFPPPAITGGSGAYLNVRGDITGEGQDDGFHLFLNLIP